MPTWNIEIISEPEESRWYLEHFRGEFPRFKDLVLPWSRLDRDREVHLVVALTPGANQLAGIGILSRQSATSNVEVVAILVTKKSSVSRLAPQIFAHVISVCDNLYGVTPAFDYIQNIYDNVLGVGVLSADAIKERDLIARSLRTALTWSLDTKRWRELTEGPSLGSPEAAASAAFATADRFLQDLEFLENQLRATPGAMNSSDVRQKLRSLQRSGNQIARILHRLGEKLRRRRRLPRERPKS
jgi:hypothetical protein